MATEIPAGQRALVKGEHLFLGRKHKGRCRRWVVMDGKVCCPFCGKLRRGETMAIGRKPLLR